MKLISSIDEVKEYSEVSFGSKLPTLKPSITTAERRHLRPVIGDALYNRLVTEYDAAGHSVGSMPAASQPVCRLAQEAITNIGLYLVVDRLAVQVSDTGIRRFEGDKEKSAFQYQEINLRESYARAGFDALDDLLAHVEANSADFDDWKSSPAYVDYKRYFIQGGVQLSAYYQVNHSRLAYQAVRYIMRRIEDQQIREVTGAALFGKLKAEVFEGNVSAANEKLLEDYIRPAVALLTISKAVIERSLEVNNDGVYIPLLSTGSQNMQVRKEAQLSKITAVADQLKSDGNEYLSRLADYLAEHADDYPDYVPPIRESRLFNIENKIDNGIFGV